MLVDPSLVTQVTIFENYQDFVVSI